MPAPPRVSNSYDYWTHPPPERSARCSYWVGRIRAGWVGNKRTRGMGYDEASHYFGVYIWEYLNVISPLLGDPPWNPVTA